MPAPNSALISAVRDILHVDAEFFLKKKNKGFKAPLPLHFPDLLHGYSCSHTPSLSLPQLF